MTRRSGWVLGVVLGVVLGLAQLIAGPYLVAVVLVLLAIWANSKLGRAGLGGLLLGVGLTTLVFLVPELLFGCAGGSSLHDSSGTTTCTGPPSSLWLWWALISGLMAIAGLALTLKAAPTTGAQERC